MRRFFSDQVSDHQISLATEESKHLSQVLRAKIGDKVEVVDGNGLLYECAIIELGKKETLLSIEKKTQAPIAPNSLWMAVAPTKNMNRWEWFLEKATEIGIGRITPMISKNSERKVLKMDRQLRILKEAMKQSQQLYLPQLDEPLSFEEILEESDAAEKYIAHCYDGSKEKLKELHQAGNKALILIGPEGDFDKSEVAAAEKKGFVSINLGESRLRTETAAIVACHTINLLDA